MRQTAHKHLLTSFISKYYHHLSSATTIAKSSFLRRRSTPTSTLLLRPALTANTTTTKSPIHAHAHAHHRTMSNISISSLGLITREDLASLFSSNTSSNTNPPTSVAIIDVRDSDHIGGHIRHSIHIPSNELDFKIPELVRTLAEKELVVFHCSLSQQRGPRAGLRYLREREKGGMGEQKVVVLEGGFVKWQEKYGEDEGLTEGFVKDIWEFGY